jgi:hypothetical protein
MILMVLLFVLCAVMCYFSDDIVVKCLLGIELPLIAFVTYATARQYDERAKEKIKSWKL